MEQDAIGPTTVRPRKVQEPAAREPEDILLCRLFFAIPFKRPGYGVGIVAVGVRENRDLLQGAAHIEKQACLIEVRCRRSAVSREHRPPVSNCVPINRNSNLLRIVLPAPIVEKLYLGRVLERLYDQKAFPLSRYIAFFVLLDEPHLMLPVGQAFRALLDGRAGGKGERPAKPKGKKQGKTRFHSMGFRMSASLIQRRIPSMTTRPLLLSPRGRSSAARRKPPAKIKIVPVAMFNC